MATNRSPVMAWYVAPLASLYGGVLLLLTLVSITTSAQLIDDSPLPGTPPPTIDVLVGWDFAGMSADEESAFWGIMHPLSDEEIEAAMTSTQIAARQSARLAMIQPQEYSNANASTLSSQQKADANVHAYLITHPAEATQFVNSQRTPEQLQHDAVARWIMLHPSEALKLMQQSITADELKAQLIATMESSNPPMKPKPIMQTIPNPLYTPNSNP